MATFGAVPPINYMQAQPDIGTQFAEGMQLGNAIRDMRQKRALQEQEIAYQTDLQAAMSGTDPRAFINLAAKYPKHGAGLKQAWEMLGEDQRNAEFNSAREVFYALETGRPDVALGVIEEQAAALKNSGRDTKKIEALRAGIERNPQQAKQYIGAFLSSVAPKEYAETLTKLGTERRAEELQPLKVEGEQAGIEGTRATTAKTRQDTKLAEQQTEKARADAAAAAVAARFAESNAVKDLEKKGWDITKIQEDVKVAKENSRIAAMNAAINRENNVIKREELKLKRDEVAQKRDEQIRGKTAEVENARFNIDNLLNTADRILATPKDVIGSAAGPISSKILTTSQATSDFEALVENLDAQAFLSQIPQMKGAGALSDAEGRKLAAALQNFSLKQSPERLVENVKEAQRLMLIARKNLANKYGVPETAPNTPAAPAAAAAQGKSVDQILRELGMVKQ